MRDTHGHTRVHSISCTGGHALCTRGHVGPRWAKMPRPARKPRREPPRGEPGAGPGRRGRSRRARGAPSRAPGAPPPSSSRFGGRDSSPPFPLRHDALFSLPSWRGGERRCRGPPHWPCPPRRPRTSTEVPPPATYAQDREAHSRYPRTQGRRRQAPEPHLQL